MTEEKRREELKSPLRPTQEDYEALSDFRYSIRCFLEFSENAARNAGLTPQQHQALLAVRGFPPGTAVTIGDLAERLRIRHHSAVELVDRLVDADLLLRRPDALDNRRVLLSLSDAAADILSQLSAVHLDELSRLRPVLKGILRRI
ncbi:MarR family transcriptional regulator [Methylovirgula ligni]|uniref:DNA-binding MarR family transcriptional regulator n=1 Tax=Methylovirgula ligni TaxID=569860 RepID=A0A3D9YYA6_9HYPH|nr:helix-turn-helix domain-containing protein [Methylovirgula ligni]QAY97133.1 MarR family transcriptional regulator [Methylovirgula ligni]REF87355.1 DNA-binding MarR family transcriptional regulator [Methylovirgula ligni]